MSRTALGHLRLVGPLAIVAATLGMSSLPALAQSAAATDCSAIKFDLANPGPGARVEHGTAIIEGLAMDTRATSGTGIDRIDFFLDNRDAGGENIGTAVPGMVPAPSGPGSFQTTVSFPNSIGGHDLFAYAHSSVTGQESVINLPIAVGEDPAKAFETPVASQTETCIGGATMMPTSGAAAPAAPAAPAAAPAAPAAMMPAATTSMAPSASTITLEVGNPSPGDTVHVGGINVSGAAWDKASTSGSGIDRIDIFLDDRDAGGSLLTEASLNSLNNNWTATPVLPSNQTGLHSLVFYAHSAVTGQQSVVSVPVTIAP